MGARTARGAAMRKGLNQTAPCAGAVNFGCKHLSDLSAWSLASGALRPRQPFGSNEVQRVFGDKDLEFIANPVFFLHIQKTGGCSFLQP
jgi:hypothetical protein